MTFTISFWRHSALGDRMASVDVPGIDAENAKALWISMGGDENDIIDIKPSDGKDKQ